MPSDRTRLALIAVVENARLADSFTVGLTAEEFEADRRTFYAVTRCLEIISEACRRLPEELRQRHPELPWRAILGVGNIYRHDYDNVDELQVWRTVHHSLPFLLTMAEGELASLGDLPGAPDSP